MAQPPLETFRQFHYSVSSFCYFSHMIEGYLTLLYCYYSVCPLSTCRIKVTWIQMVELPVQLLTEILNRPVVENQGRVDLRRYKFFNRVDQALGTRRRRALR